MLQDRLCIIISYVIREVFVQIAYSYIRFSTVEQKTGDSLRRQIELSERYAAENGLILDTSFHLQDLGLSAFDRSNIDRGALGAFLEAVKQGRVPVGSYLLVESLDRLSRDRVLSALEIFISILRHGITIVTLIDKMVYNTESVGSNFASLIMSITIMARAHEESAVKSSRILSAWQGKRSKISEKKLTAQCPRWLRLDEERTKFHVIPTRSNLVLEILAWAKAGMGQSLIAKRLNERSEPTFGHGKGWHASYIQKIMTSPALYGEFQPHLWNKGKKIAAGEPIPDYYPALISRAEFCGLQYLRSKRAMPDARARKGKDIPNLLSGLLKCGYCGSSMVMAGGAASRVRTDDGDSVTRPSKRVLVCDGARRGLGCYAVQWDYNAFEISFLSFCSSLDLASLLGENNATTTEKRLELKLTQSLEVKRTIVQDNESRLDKLLSALEVAPDSKAIVERVKKVEAELYQLREECFSIEAELAKIVYDSEDYASRETSIKTLVQKIASLTGDERFLTRSMLSEHIRKVISLVKLHPAGRLVDQEQLDHLRAELVSSGWERTRIDDYLKRTMRTEPLRTGRGIRGRYAARQDIGRFFVIEARRGGIRVVYPEYDDPSKVIVTLGTA
jgi:DNA invertase Pin-like site-specific DNA recombinase